jgi:hypothetical protein
MADKAARNTDSASAATELTEEPQLSAATEHGTGPLDFEASERNVASLAILEKKVESIHNRLAHIENDSDEEYRFKEDYENLGKAVESLHRRLERIEQEDYERKMAALESRMEGLADHVEAVLLVGKKVDNLERSLANAVLDIQRISGTPGTPAHASAVQSALSNTRGRICLLEEEEIRSRDEAASSVVRSRDIALKEKKRAEKEMAEAPAEL